MPGLFVCPSLFACKDTFLYNEFSAHYPRFFYADSEKRLEFRSFSFTDSKVDDILNCPNPDRVVFSYALLLYIRSITYGE